ncbi:hypothetical protein F4824DRAFT_469113 [Ustulina deusta]|nr:hypothetical protein F4824DRAFT_469113 [Ustulina deusta]
MARLSLALLVAAMLQVGSSLPLVEERQFSPSFTQSGFPIESGFPTGFPTEFPTATQTVVPSGFPTGDPTGFTGAASGVPTAFPSGLPGGFPGSGFPVPTGFPQHGGQPQQPGDHRSDEQGSGPAEPEKRNIPVTPKWLRWLPFERINL